MMGPKSGILEPLTRLFTSQQSDMIATYSNVCEYGGDEMVLASRGEGKTTYLRGMILKGTSEGKVGFAVFVGATLGDATNSLQAIQEIATNSKPFIRLYPEIAIPAIAVGKTPQRATSMLATGPRYDDGRKRFTEKEISFKWSATEIDFPNVPGSPSARAMLRFKGADAAIRGLNLLGRRPDVIALDDLDSPDTVNNMEIARKVIGRVDRDIGGLGSQTEPLARVMLATLPEQGIGVAHHYVKQGFPFSVRRHKFMVEKPIRMDMWKDYIAQRKKDKRNGDTHGRTAHQYYVEHFEAMNEGAEVSNEHRFIGTACPDGSQKQLTAVQFYFDEWADKGEAFCKYELDNETAKAEEIIKSSLEPGHVMACEGKHSRLEVDSTTGMICRGVDIRKTELHYASIASDDHKNNRIPNYDVKTHPGTTTETTVEQAEEKILLGLRAARKTWDETPFIDEHGQEYKAALTLIDKGWKGSWNTEDGEEKSWVSNPVQVFCMESGLRKFLPAKGMSPYRAPSEGDGVIIGDNWHMNRGIGAERMCTEVIWNAAHYHRLVEECFMLPLDDPDCFSLFVATSDIWSNHSRISEHIHSGAQELAEARRSGRKTRKPGYRRDHWWDSLAMALVAKSIEEWFRKNLVRRKPVKQKTFTAPQHYEEIGAR